MSGFISRRALLARAGGALAGTAAAQMLGAVAMAQQPASSPAAGLCMSMLFLNNAKAKFEADKYTQKHLPMLRDLYGDSVERIELRTSTGSAMGVPSALLATATLWIRDVPGFSQKLAASAERINKDLDGLAKGNRMVQVDRIVLEVGEGRAEVPLNSQVFSMYYPAAAMGPGGAPGGAGDAAPRFDADYFVQVYLPKLYSLYGSNAVRRVEATLGLEQGGQKPTHVGAYHLLIRDRGAYDEKSRAVFSEMQKDAGKFTTIFPMLADLRLTAVG